jgi:hypothetical protein
MSLRLLLSTTETIDAAHSRAFRQWLRDEVDSTDKGKSIMRKHGSRDLYDSDQEDGMLAADQEHMDLREIDHFLHGCSESRRFCHTTSAPWRLSCTTKSRQHSFCAHMRRESALISTATVTGAGGDCKFLAIRGAFEAHLNWRDLFGR